MLVYPVAIEKSDSPKINLIKAMRLMENVKTRQNSRKKVKWIFLKERSIKTKAIRTWLMAEFSAILEEPANEPERKLLRKRISSMPSFTENIISRIVRMPISKAKIEKKREDISSTGEVN
jgi:hypothetical protein